MMRQILRVVLFALLPATALAQVSVTADRIYLGATGCPLRTGAGSPSGGMSCELFLSTTTGDIWMNVGGTWRIITTSPTVQTITATTSMTTPLLTAAADLRLNPAANVVLDPVGRKILPMTNYGISLGSPTRQFLDLHIAELWAESLVAQDVMSTIGGRILVGPTTTLTAPLTAVAGGITVKQNNLASGDILLLQNAPDGIPQTEWMAVTSAPGGGPGAYTYTVTRNLDGSGANVWVEGDAVFNTGTTGTGFIDAFALRGVVTGFGPTIVGNIRTGTAFNAISPRWAVGNLNGIGYGHGINIYGFAAGNPSGAFLTADDTYGIVMTGPLGTRVHISPSGVATFVGDGGGVTNINGGNIQTDTITASQIGANAITASEIAAGAVTADKIVAGAITAEKIATGAITADKIAAGAITADKLTVGGEGAALNPDPGPTHIGNWPGSNVAVIDFGTVGIAGRYGFSGGSGGTFGLAASARLIPVDPAKTYRIHAWAAPGAVGTDGNFYLAVRLLDGTGASVVGSGEWFFCAGLVLPTGWSEYQCPFGAGTANPFHPNGKSMAPVVYLNFGGTVGYHLVQDVRIEEMTPSTLIKDGAITTAKIIANAITSDKIIANAINAGHIQAGAISAGHIAANSISASHLQADSVTSAHIQAGTITGGDIAAATIAGGHIAANTITGGNIAANTISADRLNVSTLSAISSNIGTITAGTITGVLIDGVTILAGSGDEVRLDNNGITVSSSGGSGPGAIKIGGTSIWADANALSLNAAQTYARGYLEVQGELYATGAIRGGNGTGSISLGSMAATSASISGAISATSWINTNQTFYAQAMPDAPQYYAVYWEATCKCLYKGAHSSVTRTGARTWTPENPLAILNVPLRQFDVADVIVPRTGAPEARIPGGTFVGLLAEDLVSLAPAAVIRDPQGRPDAIRSEVFDVYLLAAIKAVNDRVPRLEERIQFLEQRLAVLEAARRGGMDR